MALKESDWNAIDKALPAAMRESWLLTPEGERLIDAVESIVAEALEMRDA